MYRNFAKSQAMPERYSPTFTKTSHTRSVESLPALKSPIEYQPLFQSMQVESLVKPEQKSSAFEAAAISIIGRRPTNEDRHLIVEQESVQFFGIFDGHGGDEAAQYCASNYEEEYASLSQAIGNIDTAESTEVLLRQIIAQLDQNFSKESRFSTVGTTACLLIAQHGHLYYSNTGDSRCIVCYGNGQIFESKDHSPANERRRLVACGAKIIKCEGIDRVDGNLSVARGVGDQYMKSKGIISDPDVGQICRSEEVKFAVVACDGLFGIFSTESVCNIVNSCLGGRAVPGAPQERLLEAAAAYFVGDTEHGDQLLAKVVGQRIYKTKACCDVEGITSGPARRIAQILCRLAYWKGSMDNVSVLVVLK